MNNEQRTTNNDRAKKVLLLRPGAFGDVCMTVPFAAALARHCEVHWLIHEAYEPVPRVFGIDVRLIPLTPDHGWRGLNGRPIRKTLIDRLRNERFDAVLDLAHWPRTAWLVSQLADIPIRAISFDPAQDGRLQVNPRGLDLYEPFNVRVPVSESHQVAKWQALARASLGVDATLDWPQTLRRTSGGELKLFVHPHASKPAKRWPAHRFAAVVCQLARERPVRCFINSGSRHELPAALGLWLRLRTAGVRAEIVWLDRNCRRLRDALENVDLALGCDSGPMHFAALVGTPSVVIFGPYPAAEFGPLWRSTAVEPAAGKPASAVPTKAVLAACREVADTRIQREFSRNPAGMRGRGYRRFDSRSLAAHCRASLRDCG
jgi:ADP-heptose:LPS heptosyltransferase